jgi:uncharacterized protein
MNLTERLRGVVRSSGGSAAHGVPGPGPADCLYLSPVDPASTDAADLLDGEWREASGQRYIVVERSYPPGHRHGRAVVADSAPDCRGYWPALSLLEPSIGQARPVFIDLETTGLAGGAGTYAFLVGCGWFEGVAFRVRQFVLASYGAERALLEDVAGTAAEAGALVKYNGKTFDMPLLETRFLFHRMKVPFAGIPHVDILHAARRLWRQRSMAELMPRTTCCLSALEESILGHVRDHDVPGYAIPSRYFEYVRSGDEHPLAVVLEHNRLDLLSLALLTSRTAYLLDEGADAAETAREAYGLGCLYLRGGRVQEARTCFARAASMETVDPCTAAEALRAFAVLARSSRQYDEAATAWRRLLQLHSCPPRLVQEASEALAVHHEHRDEDFQLARDLARQSLRLATSASRVQAVQHRLTRLDRKLAGSKLGRNSQHSICLF